MGNWAIVIHGVGCHHNKKLPSDANRMSAEFVEALKQAGHTITSATFTHGGEDNITDGKAYIEMRELYEKG
jgi:hypothetical protein